MAASPDLGKQLFDDGVLAAVRLGAEPIGPVGVTPWRRTASDPWDPWFRYAVGASFMGGKLDGVETFGLGLDLQAQWKALVATAEYLYVEAKFPALDQQGAVIEPGISVWGRRIDLVARGDWRRIGGTSEWGGGAAVTAYAPWRGVRAQVGFERRTAAGLPSGWAIARITIATN
jgi:hypothetical protein